MLAVKLVVHGLVEFIQNFSKKSYDTPQVRDQKNTRREMGWEKCERSWDNLNWNSIQAWHGIEDS